MIARRQRRAIPSRTERLLDKLDTIIADLGLDKGDPLIPLNPALLFERESIETARWWMPDPVHGISTHYEGEAGITFNWLLWEFEMSGWCRRAHLHEWGHVKEGHVGSYLVGHAEWKEGDRWLGYVHGQNERDAEIIAAYMAVRKRALQALNGYGTDHIAAVLDVPPCLVDTRRGILRNYGR